MTRSIVSSANPSGSMHSRHTKSLISLRRISSYFSPARSRSGSNHARHLSKASWLSTHSVFTEVCLPRFLRLRLNQPGKHHARIGFCVEPHWRVTHRRAVNSTAHPKPAYVSRSTRVGRSLSARITEPVIQLRRERRAHSLNASVLITTHSFSSTRNKQIRLTRKE